MENESCHIGRKWNGCGWSYYRGRTEAFSIKIGLSIFAVTGCCSLCDELTGKGPSSPTFKNATVAVLEGICWSHCWSVFIGSVWKQKTFFIAFFGVHHVVASRPVANQLDIIGYLLLEVSVPNSFLSPSENTPKFVDKTLPTFWLDQFLIGRSV